MFTIDVVTLFPELFAPFVGLSIVGRAVESGLAAVRYHHLLDELGEGERADDAPFGGGPGMVLRIEPIARVLDRIVREAPAGERRAIVVPSPERRALLAQAAAQRWAGLDRLVIVCGHYEGIDDRLGAPLSGRRTLARRFRADRRRDSRARLHGRDRSPARRRRAAGIAAERILRRGAARLPELHPPGDAFAESTCLRSSCRAITRRSRSGGASSPGGEPCRGGGTCSTMPPCRPRKAHDRIRWFCRAPRPALRCAGAFLPFAIRLRVLRTLRSG